jgi:hypothetical protein
MATDMGNRFSPQQLREGYEASRDVVQQQFQEHPLPAALTVFGLGFGLGLAIGVLMSDSEPSYASRMDSRWFDRYGRQFLEAVVRAVPEAVSKRIS